MNSIKDRAALIAEAAKKMNKGVYNDANVKKDLTPRHELQRKSSKVVTLEEAIKKSGLKDGMTISFHHHFRGGDKVINMVVAKLAEMGFKNLHLASSSLIDVHEPLIEHIKNGVITQHLDQRSARCPRYRGIARPDEGARCVPFTRFARLRHQER